MHDPLVVAFSVRRPWPRLRPEPARAGTRWDWGHGRGLGWRPSPFVTVAGRRFYFPPFLTVWHREPDGRDSGEVCAHWRTVVDGPARERIRLAVEALEQAQADRLALLGRFGGPSLAELDRVEKVLAEAIAAVAKARKGRRVRDDRWRLHVHHWRLQVHPLQGLRRWALTRCGWCSGRSRRGDVVNVSHGWDRPAGRWWQGEPGLFHHWCSAAAIAWRTCTCQPPRFERPGLGHGKCLACDRFRPYSLDPWQVEQVEAWRRSTPYGTHPTPEAWAEAVEMYQRAKSTGAAR